MRALTMMQAAWRPDTKRGEHLTFENCKGGFFSTNSNYALKIEGKTDGDRLVKAGSLICCDGKNHWDIGNILFQGSVSGLLLSLPAGTYTFSADESSDGPGTLYYIASVTCQSNTTNHLIRRENSRARFTFSVQGGEVVLSISSSNDPVTGEQTTAMFKNIMVEEGETATDYAPHSHSEITPPCDLQAGDVWYPAFGKVTRADGSDEAYPAQNLIAAKGKCLVHQSPIDLPADITATVPVRR